MTDHITKNLELGRLKKRPEFLFVAAKSKAGKNLGSYCAKPSVVVQVRKNAERTNGINAGFTATKRIGNAVVRNRAKRRLRVCAQTFLPLLGKPGHDYVFIARNITAGTNWARLTKDVEKALLTLQ
jgi:ribonuclease P protein component